MRSGLLGLLVATAGIAGCWRANTIAVAAAESPDYTGKRVVQWTGRAADLRYIRRKADYYTADDFSFQFSSPKQGRWQVVSREPTPFETWRFGTTFTGLKVDWSGGPEVRLTGVKGVDRIPATYPGLTLDPDRTVTALALEVRVGDEWKPWYVNNWFHAWSTPEEQQRILGMYAGKESPWDIYGFRSDAPAELTAASRQATARFPEWRAYHGVIIRDPKGGFALELRHAFQKNPATGGHDCVIGDPKTLVPLSRLSPVSSEASPAVRPEPEVVEAAAPAPKPEPAAEAGWWMVGGGPEHRGVAPALAPPLKPAWEAKGGKEFAGGPVSDGGRVYIGNNDGKLYCFRAGNGAPLWTFSTGAEIEATPTVSGGAVLVGSFDGNLYSVDAASGKERWRFKTGPRLTGFTGIDDVKQGVDSSVAVVGGRAYFGAWDGKAYCLEAASGKLVWSRQLGGIVHWSSPAVSGGKMVLGATDGKLYCLTASDGAILWTAPLAERHSDAMMSGPSIADGTVFVGGGYDNRMHAVRLADGRRLWSYPAHNLVASTPAISGDHVFGFADADGQVFCLDRNSGKEVWSSVTKGGWGASNSVVSGGAIYVTMRGAADGLVALDAASGRVIWTSAGGPAWAGPAIAGGMLFYGSDDGKLRAFTR
jgi:outer membrane protein assembly factor BamB